MTSIFEQLSGTYTQGSDGMLYPNLTLGDREQRPIGRWGRIHRVYLETEHPGLYDRMILNVLWTGIWQMQRNVLRPCWSS